jgi:hypothetical protein
MVDMMLSPTVLVDGGSSFERRGKSMSEQLPPTCRGSGDGM